MKKILLTIFTAVALVGCTLDEEVISSSEPSKYYQTVPQCQTGLNGCYIPLRSIYANYNYFEVCEVATDLMYHTGSSYYDAHADYSPSQPRFGSNIWNHCYLGVMRCNAMYAAIQRSPLSESEKAPLLAEAVILRAFYYYILTINFENVPYYFEEVTDANNDKISKLPRMDAKVLREKLMDQLSYYLCSSDTTWEPINEEYQALLAEYKLANTNADGEAPEVKCLQALPYIKTYDPANEYRIGSMVGFVVGGKLAMWNENWPKAIEFYGYVETVYRCLDTEGGYNPQASLMDYPVSDIMFRNRYTPESIFEIPGYARDYGLRVTSQLAAHCTPPRKSSTTEGEETEDPDFDDELVDYSESNDIYNGIKLPSLGGSARTASPYRPTKYFYYHKAFTNYLGGAETKGLMPYGNSGTSQTKTYDKRRSTYDTSKYSQFNDSMEVFPVEDGGGYLAWCYAGWGKDENGDYENPETVGAHMLFFSSVGTQEGRPFLGDKFWCPGMVYNQDSNNLKIFRFAHVVLDLAEACMWMERWEEAVGYLNAPRQRAGLTPIGEGDVATDDTFMKALQEESARELFGEFTRRHNLVRWGIWRENIMKYSDSSVLRENVTAHPYLEYYPIPDEQVILSNGNLDNNKYNGIE